MDSLHCRLLGLCLFTWVVQTRQDLQKKPSFQAAPPPPPMSRAMALMACRSYDEAEFAKSGMSWEEAAGTDLSFQQLDFR